MDTSTKTRNATKVAVIVGVLLIAGAAVAYGAGIFGGDAYRQVSVACYDGATLKVEVTKQGDRWTYKTPSGAATVYYLPTTCLSPKEWNKTAARYCAGHRSQATGKVGVNSFAVTMKCSPQSGTGYGYNGM